MRCRTGPFGSPVPQVSRLSGGRILWRGALLALSAGGLLSVAPLFQQGDEEEPIERAQGLVREWVDTHRLLSQERRDWRLSRELLGERIELVQREIASFRASVAEAEESISEADRKRAELVRENDALKGTARDLAVLIAELEARMKQLLPRLPEHARELIGPLTQRIPEDPDDTEPSLGTRYETVVGSLNLINKLHRDITEQSELRELEDGTTAEVAAVYLGIGQGMYVTSDAGAAGVGSGAGAAWSWTSDNAAASPIAKVIQILQGAEGAAFVHVPVSVAAE